MAVKVHSAAKLLGYARRYKALLISTLLMDVLGFAVTFIFPWLIGSAIDRVISHAAIRATRPTTPARCWSCSVSAP